MRLAAATVTLFLLYTGCGSRPQVAIEKEQYELGVLSNFDVPEAEDIAGGVVLAVREYNREADSAYRVTVRRFSSKGSPEGAAQAASNLIARERVIGAVAIMSDQEALAAGRILQEKSLPLLASRTTGVAVPAEGWRGFRRMAANDRQQGAAVAGETGRRAGTAGTAVLFDSSGQAFAEGLRNAAPTANLSLSRDEKVSDKADPKSIGGNVAGQAPGALVFSGETARGHGIAQGARGAGFKGPIFLSSQARASAPGVDGAFTVSGFAEPRRLENGSFAAAFRTRMSTAPPEGALESYEAAWMLLEAIEEVEPKPQTLVEFLRLNVSFLGDSKLYNYDGSGELVSPPVWLYEAKSGAWQLRDRIEVKTSRTEERGS